VLIAPLLSQLTPFLNETMNSKSWLAQNDNSRSKKAQNAQVLSSLDLQVFSIEHSRKHQRKASNYQRANRKTNFDEGADMEMEKALEYAATKKRSES